MATLASGSIGQLPPTQRQERLMTSESARTFKLAAELSGSAPKTKEQSD